mgnify:FL=1
MDRRLILNEEEFDKFCWQEYCNYKRCIEFLGLKSDDFDTFKENNLHDLLVVFKETSSNPKLH